MQQKNGENLQTRKKHQCLSSHHSIRNVKKELINFACTLVLCIAFNVYEKQLRNSYYKDLISGGIYQVIKLSAGWSEL